VTVAATPIATRKAPGSRSRKRGPGRPTNGVDFDSRDALLRAAHEMMVESRGMPVPLSAIGKRAGVDISMVHYHFENRLGLITALFERLCAAWVADLTTLVAMEAPAIRKLEIHVGRLIRNYRLYPYTTRVMNELLGSHKPSLARRMRSNFFKPLIEFYEKLIAQGTAAGEFRQLDPTFFFLSVVGQCELLFTAEPTLVAGASMASIDDVVEEAFARHTTALLLHGVQQR
jgi:AcrR family transcriptional regulator